MKVAHSLVALAFAGTFSCRSASGQSISVNSTPPAETVTITEPGKITLERLFQMSDVVVVVQILSGDTENYKTAIYKALVVKSFKGSTDGKTIYFGPFVGYKLGSEYVLFLRNAKGPAVPASSPTAAYGTVNSLEVFDQGYSAMDSSYQCVFEETGNQTRCGYAVRVCTDYITLPKGVTAYPPEENDPPFGCRWLRRSKFLELLGEFSHPGELRVP
jgi:hypothetical protein